MDTFTSDEAQKNLDELIGRTTREHRHCKITSAEGAVVMLPAETYNNIAVTLELLSTPGLLNGVQTNEVDQVAS